MFHAASKNHHIALNVRYVQKQSGEEAVSQKITKLAVGKPGGIDFSDEEWELWTTLRCLTCGTDLDKPEALTPMFDSIMASNSALFQSGVEEWEMEYHPCEHTLTLQQEPV
jgi:ubiquitin carboxyl-terminal hydrolase 5/13